MGIVYRYVDLNDNETKYVGIIWSNNRTLKQRIDEHYKNDLWCDRGHWRIEYLQKDINSRTDAEFLEAHYTNRLRNPNAAWFGKAKIDWGTSTMIDDSNDKWELYISDEEKLSNFKSESFIHDFHTYNKHPGIEKPLCFYIGNDNKTFYGFFSLMKIHNTHYYIKSFALLQQIIFDAGLGLDLSGDRVEKIFYELNRHNPKIRIIRSEVSGRIEDIYYGKYHFKVVHSSLELVIDSDYIKQLINDKEKIEVFEMKEKPVHF